MDDRPHAHWDAVARGMPDLCGLASTAYYRRCEQALIRREIGPLRGRRMLKLDLWNEAVNTRILNWMAEEGASCFGLDVSREVAGRARRNAHAAGDRLHLVQADIRHVPFADAAFDAVYTMGTIEHIDEYRLAVREVARVLKPGGRAIIGVPHKWNLFLRPLLVTVLDRFGKYPYSPEKSFSARALREVVEQAGLRVTRRTGILTVPGIVRMFDVFLFRRRIVSRRLVPLVLWPFDRLETRWRWPGHFGYLIAVVAEKDEAAGAARDR